MAQNNTEPINDDEKQENDKKSAYESKKPEQTSGQ